MHFPNRLSRALLSVLIVSVSATAFAADKRSENTSAFLKSLVIPGWGQYSLDRKNAALTFFGAELMLVGGMLTLNSYSRSTKADYLSLASAYAGVTGGHDHDFYVDVGNWMTVDQFNERRLQERNFDALYTDPSDHWTWDTDAHRAEMEKVRLRSDRAHNNVLYLVGGLVLNHVASAIHAGRVAAIERQKAAAPKPTSWNIGFEPVAPSSGLQVRFTRTF
jgi:hypothetical protein